MTEDLMTSRELARYLKVDLRTLYRYIKQGQIPKVKMGGRWRFRRSDIETWLRGESPVRQPSRPPAKRILVVEDNPAVVALVNEILQGGGYNVQSAPSGEEALAMLREISYNLLIVDLKLPKMNGLAFIARAEELYEVAAHCVIMTAYGSKGSAIEAVNRGIRKFLEKPFSVEQLLGVVESALRA